MFWTTWCYFCRLRLAELNDLDLASYNVEFFFINLGERRSRVKEFIQDSDYNPYIREHILLDRENLMAEKFNIIGIPTFVLLENGEVVYEGYFFSPSLMKEVFQQ
jgi:thiol-disulfide isomerase/thioredoxin